jgi:hypothetical protein
MSRLGRLAERKRFELSVQIRDMRDEMVPCIYISLQIPDPWRRQAIRSKLRQ